MTRRMTTAATLLLLTASTARAQDAGPFPSSPGVMRAAWRGDGGARYGGGFGGGRVGGYGGGRLGGYGAGGYVPGGYGDRPYAPRAFEGPPRGETAYGAQGVRRGQVLPPAYRGAYVPDPGRYHLRAAPPGYGWVGDGRNAYLTQRSTGLVLDRVPGAYEPAPAWRRGGREGRGPR